MGFIAPSVSSFQARSGNLAGLTISLPNRHGPSLQLIFREGFAVVGRRKSGQGDREGQEVEELLVPNLLLLLVNSFGHSASAFLSLPRTQEIT